MASRSTRDKRAGKRRGGNSTPGNGAPNEDGLTEYEKERVSRIRENQERLKSLGLRSLASALLGSSGSPKQGQKREEEKADFGQRGQTKKSGRGGEEDDEYRPSEEGETDGVSSSDERGTDEAEEVGEEHASCSVARGRSRGKKKKISTMVKAGKKLPIQTKMDEVDDMDEEAALQKAIAISLEEPVKSLGNEANTVSQFSTVSSSARHRKIVVNDTPETNIRGKTKKMNTKGPQMTEDEMIAYFFSFDEVGKGSITLRDLMRTAAAHDFCWTDKDMTDMICLFDSNNDGQLSLEDFRAIVSRCNMLRESGKS